MGYEKYGKQLQDLFANVRKNRGIDAEETLKYCEMIIEYAEQTKDDRLFGFAYYYMGETYYVLNDVESLFFYMAKALCCLECSDEWELAARAYNLLAITSFSRGNAPFAMDYYLNGLSYCKRFHFDETGIIISMNIGALYMNFGEFEQAQLYFEESFQLLGGYKKLKNYKSYLAGIYIGLARCCLNRNDTERSLEYTKKAKKECQEFLSRPEKLYYMTFMAEYMHVQGNKKERDAYIVKIQKQIDENFAIMDLFDELFRYCTLLMEIKKYNELWENLSVLEKLARKAKIINMQRKITSLKLKYFKLVDDKEGYQKAAGIYYELSEGMEQESHYMVSAMLNLRSSLDRETRIRREIQKENELLLHKSETDALTGLSNRFRLNSYAENAFQTAYDLKRSLAVEILDIDYFKQYNDKFGH